MVLLFILIKINLDHTAYFPYFKWQSHQPYASCGEAGTINSHTPHIHSVVPSDLFFAKPVTTNTHTTQAILSIFLNTANWTPDGIDNTMEKGVGSNDKLKIGPALLLLKSFYLYYHWISRVNLLVHTNRFKQRILVLRRRKHSWSML